MAKRGPKPNATAGYPHYDLGGQIAVTREQHDFCKRRVGGLTAWSEVSHRSLIDLLANAYFLGMQDAADYLTTRRQTNRPRGGRIRLRPERTR